MWGDKSFVTNTNFSQTYPECIGNMLISARSEDASSHRYVLEFS